LNAFVNRAVACDGLNQAAKLCGGADMTIR
jgi:hypothetical protein